MPTYTSCGGGGKESCSCSVLKLWRDSSQVSSFRQVLSRRRDGKRAGTRGSGLDIVNFRFDISPAGQVIWKGQMIDYQTVPESLLP